MSVELICPECGGVIGGRGTSPEGRGPCTCAKEDSAAGMSREGDASDTVSIPAPQGEAETTSAPAAVTSAPAPAPVSAGPAKLCMACGKNLAGHRRVKDSRGYLCYDCAKKEVKAEKEGTIPCAECKRRVKEAGLLNYKGRKICKLCYDHNKEQERLKKKIDTKHFDESEKSKIKILAIIFAVLTVIVLWGVIRSMMNH